MGEYLDRSQVIAEVYPGAANEMEGVVQEAGGWVCEEHPHLEWPHDDCPGPGMPRNRIDLNRDEE